MKYLMFGHNGKEIESFYGISTNNPVIEESCTATKLEFPKHILGGLTFDGLKSGVRKDRLSYTVFLPVAKAPKYAVFGVAKKKVVALYGFVDEVEGIEHTQTLPPNLLQGRTASGRLGTKGRYNPVNKKYDAQPFYVEVK